MTSSACGWLLSSQPVLLAHLPVGKKRQFQCLICKSKDEHFLDKSKALCTWSLRLLFLRIYTYIFIYFYLDHDKGWHQWHSYTVVTQTATAPNLTAHHYMELEPAYLTSKYSILQLTPTYPASLLQTAGSTVGTGADALIFPKSSSLAVHVI